MKVELNQFLYKVKLRIDSYRDQKKIAESQNGKKSGLERKVLYWDEASSFFSDKYLENIGKITLHILKLAFHHYKQILFNCKAEFMKHVYSNIYI